MKKVQRSEIVDYVTYAEQRPALLSGMLAVKEARRVVVGRYLTFLFENRDTVRFQVQEMMRVERIVRESDIQHELDTYNDLLGGAGELGCTLLIGIDDPERRAVLLQQWIELPAHLYARLADGRKVRPTYDPRQVGRGRLSAVQYLKFPTGGEVPVAIGSDLPSLIVEAELGAEQREALREDLA